MGESLYVHFPYCVHLCNYCDFYKKKLDGAASVKSFEDRLQSDWEKVVELAKSAGKEIGKEFDTIYLGGGTPSLWDKDGARFFRSMMSNNSLSLNSDGEFTLETDPGAWTENGLEEWRRAGANRFSLGIQAYDEDFLKIMDRHHDRGEAQKTLKYFKEIKANFSADLMLGLPYSRERKRNVIEELKRIMDFGPSHLSVYILKTRSNYPHNGALPDDSYISDEYLLVSEFLQERGLFHYEVSNFSKPGSKSKHNIKYWKATDVHALGPNATGFMRTSKGAVRYQHKPSGGSPTLEKLDHSALLLEEVYLGLRTDQGLDLEKLLLSKAPESRRELIELTFVWGKSGYLKENALNGLILSPRGYLMIDSIIDDLFKKNLL